jgi:hypothetical protein
MKKYVIVITERKSFGQAGWASAIRDGNQSTLCGTLISGSTVKSYLSQG